MARSTKKREKRMARNQEQADALKETEAQRVYAWRLYVLEERGMPRQLAKRVADSDLDLHVACRALDAGCSPELLLDIAL